MLDFSSLPIPYFKADPHPTPEGQAMLAEVSANSSVRKFLQESQN